MLHIHVLHTEYHLPTYSSYTFYCTTFLSMFLFSFLFFFASRWNSQGHSIQSQSYKLLFLWCGWNSAVLCFHAWINLLMWSYVTPYMHRKGSLLTPVKMLYISALSRGFLILPLESNIRFLGSKQKVLIKSNKRNRLDCSGAGWLIQKSKERWWISKKNNRS